MKKRLLRQDMSPCQAEDKSWRTNFYNILENKDSKLRNFLPPQNTKCYNLRKSRKFNPVFKTKRFRIILF